MRAFGDLSPARSRLRSSWAPRWVAVLLPAATPDVVLRYAHEFQGWTLKRVKLLIGRTFHVGYTIQGGARHCSAQCVFFLKHTT